MIALTVFPVDYELIDPRSGWDRQIEDFIIADIATTTTTTTTATMKETDACLQNGETRSAELGIHWLVKRG